ncbi:DUF1801 domain-containing protein [Kocuria sp. cx-116]|uniref:DUF1801 domain-containing protein n=1 Tax=Kocuria sp. cx-116 TaxID=2771378 RepID=UPI0016845939|nr:DUF1801 domain-containing protein [Kocuria sp. cx-116]MBD2761926.1 DUF1801 domain-containing protein [Kocuria sp. cx-116]
MTALTEIKGTGAPLHRALAERGITELEQLAGADFQELLALHGVGLKGLNRFNDALGEQGLEPMSGVVAPKSSTTTTKADVKTKPSEQSAEDWIESLPWPRRVEQGRALLEIFHEATGVEPVMWGPSIVGYGHLHYRHETGREGDTARVGFSPRKAAISLYGLQGDDVARELLDRLGPHRRGAGCIYVTALDAVDQDVLRELIVRGWESTRAR